MIAFYVQIIFNTINNGYSVIAEDIETNILLQYAFLSGHKL